MRDRDVNELPVGLQEAVRLLRQPPAPSDLWRQRLLRDIAVAPRPSAVRRLSVRPLTAIAAGLLCAIIGAGAIALILRPDGSSGAVSVASAPSAMLPHVRFTLDAPTASRVFVVGDFNQWNPTALPLRRTAAGVWEIDVPLAPGRYVYSFVVDGKLALDPAAARAADDDFGFGSSVLMVKGGGSGS
jgi:hypothetical protein